MISPPPRSLGSRISSGVGGFCELSFAKLFFSHRSVGDEIHIEGEVVVTLSLYVMSALGVGCPMLECDVVVKDIEKFGKLQV